ncbi:hypothetical protein COCNU_06G007800 [Cocos nucifera]|uniref:Uncharacterized protein n=1 Tax=Cocos nucifera TaxID=13894 RepID=A0A8K0ICB8_COCNU|nr:hypothetical protein COCNU_06G007800 [Cocos nucifera]
MELLVAFRSRSLGLLGERCGAHPRYLFTDPERETMDLVLGLLVSATYHSWLLLTILRHPKRTVIGLNALAGQRWVRAMGP